MNKEKTLNGVLVVDKPEGLTSRDVVNKVSHIFKTKKVGHTGTLDPLATGVLVVVMGKYTRLSMVLTSEYKEYIATFELGYETDTLDITGNKTKTGKVSFSEDEIRNAIFSFRGKYLQEVPAYSAVKVGGKRLYDYARSDEVVNLPKRMVDIHNIEILSIDKNIITIDVRVSKGTYIRSLIRDIGVKLGSYATMVSLRRISQGKFRIDEAYTLEEIENGSYKLLDLEDIIDDIETVELDEDLNKKVTNGVMLPKQYNHDFVLFRENGEDVALYKKEKDSYRMFIKF